VRVARAQPLGNKVFCLALRICNPHMLKSDGGVQLGLEYLRDHKSGHMLASAVGILFVRNGLVVAFGPISA